MHKKSNEPQKVKSSLHPRNKNKERYNFKLLIENSEELKPFVKLNKYNSESIDFADPKAVKALNKALLKTHYGISYWDVPENYLCPPIPGRADYIHHMADLLRDDNYGKIPEGDKIVVVDVGIGANCIYPIVGVSEYGWSFIGADIDEVAIESANKIINENELLKGKVECRLQNNEKDFFYNVLSKDEIVDLTVCNPPFHASAEDAQKGTLRKQSNLKQKKVSKATLNFGGQSNELWYEGGERRFIHRMIKESKRFSTNCFWFSTLVSKQSHLESVYAKLKEIGAAEVKTIAMSTGNKSTRIVAWTFLHENQQKDWRDIRWNKK